MYFLPEIDKDAMRLLFPYTLDAPDVYAIDEDAEDNVPASHGLLRMSPKTMLQLEGCVKVRTTRHTTLFPTRSCLLK
jgi:hypothetical protein